ncbi:MAG TPA: hypothetical protein DGG95_13515 [Cytophagales bacterium]|nr:hypothetical protein [Cytophagales bacterium]
MLDIIGSYWIQVSAPGRLFPIDFTIDPLPQGTNVYATISLSAFNTGFPINDPDPTQKSAAIAKILSHTIYVEGKETGRIPVQDNPANGLFIYNCARITFQLSGQYISAKALINIFRF